WWVSARSRRTLVRSVEVARRWLGHMGSLRVRLALWYLTMMSLLLALFGGLLVTTMMGVAPYYHQQLMLQLGEQMTANYQPQTGQVRVPQPLPESGDLVVVVDASGAVTQTVGPISAQALTSLRGLATDNSQDANVAETSSHLLTTSTGGRSAYG